MSGRRRWYIGEKEPGRVGGGGRRVGAAVTVVGELVGAAVAAALGEQGGARRNEAVAAALGEQGGARRNEAFGGRG